MKMMAELSLYPLREPDLALPIHDFIAALRSVAGIEMQIGPTSTVISGEADAVFDAVRAAYLTATATGQRVLVVKYINENPAAEMRL